jgi:hypothetical protein
MNMKSSEFWVAIDVSYASDIARYEVIMAYQDLHTQRLICLVLSYFGGFGSHHITSCHIMLCHVASRYVRMIRIGRVRVKSEANKLLIRSIEYIQEVNWEGYFKISQ